MSESPKSARNYASYGVAALIALVLAYVGYSFFLARKPLEEAPATAETTPGELAVDLNAKQVEAISIGVVGSRTFVISNRGFSFL